ncbi:MAG TPA: peptidoglycan bridge formation glycyltransferase FemA/FemB family protein, partial [Propionibacteriaceae bacterium]|nr:peptidoglycan bridge formation glycyltransferase FemA/FemB family protein [Propionibacteriaceae bacterium]
MTIQVRTITPAEHLAYFEARAADPGFAPTVSFLQTPAWAKVKPEWTSETLGWFSGTQLVGVGLVLYRQLPKVKRYLAYLPEGPVLDWAREDIADFLPPLAKHVKATGAFGLRIGPTLVHRRWNAATIKDAVADAELRTLSQASPDETHLDAVRLANTLTHLGWKRPKDGEGFAAGQPKFNFQLPLAGRTPEQVLAGMNQLWRRNIKKADKVGVEVSTGGRDDLAAFHELYLITAERDHFTPRPLAYFDTMWDALNTEMPDRMRVYLARHEGDVVAATTGVRVGKHAWYSYGASSNEKRDVRGSNAIQWRMIRDSIEAGAEVYDL